ncbi:2-polyprenyl-3-methyl-6-methoxy-1,4-benzoquinone monooxygenase [Mitsuaria sp. WAJ17]|uniref:2-polyprenyl-3-methyl-6-methoxy-1,4-benzoquinone monooxygenase n=1 Tax=Mitsuaria sp. WAJ17 TaxID=2761452 RepID=UPI001603F2E1|nr:2-polyprenyl-3-methyl-6-methoxy-1,4-benzoquinone monooxygenase [Mitsuaria sp. WAJ17]MBB2484909.1 2-polyprenyl-3-methyl-6-methoxy-1,4-benzoquinone monooxygenase [Mitsuaria sp. WAJ17]
MPTTLDFKDRLLSATGHGLLTVFGRPAAGRPNPAQSSAASLDESQRRLAGALMRVNHVGEVCAQALYQSQALLSREEPLRRQLEAAAAEEIDHLAWTRERLDELKDRPSLLNPFWYGGAFALGSLAGLMGDRISLGFLVETERQVEQHLASHLDRLPAEDLRSREIVDRMKAEEAEHAQHAQEAGAAELPTPVPGLMRLAARVMTTVAHRL